VINKHLLLLSPSSSRGAP